MSLLALGAAALGAGASFLSAKQQQNAQMNLQHDAQAWQENMSNTAHQREIEDLKAAGLNPVLSAGGQGASTGSVGEGSASMADMSAGINSGLTAMKSAELIDAQKENLKADSNLKDKTGAKTESEKNLIDIQSKLEPQVKNAAIKLNNAQSAKAKQDIQESISREFANTISNQLKSMDLEKRQWGYDTELDLYKKELENLLIDAGFDQSTIGLILKAVGKTMGAASPFIDKIGKSGNTYNFNTNSPTVNY